MGCNECVDSVDRNSAVFNPGFICHVFKPFSAVACATDITNNDVNTLATNANVDVDYGKICSFLSSDWQESADDLVSEICHKVDHNEVGSTISTSEIETDDISSTVQQSCNVIQENSSSVSGKVSFPELHKFRASHRKNFVFAHLNVNGLYLKYSEIHEIQKSEYIDFWQ